MAGQIFINDDLLWQDRSLVEPLSRSWNMPRNWSLPASSLKHGENVFWIRVVAVPTQNSGLGKVFLGDDDVVMPIFQKLWYEQRVLHFFNLIFSFTLGIIAFLVWLFRRQETVFGWFALTSLFWVVFMSSTVMIVSPLGLTALQIARINSVLLFGFSVFSCFYAWRLALQKFVYLERFLIFCLAAFSVAGFLTSDEHLRTYILICFASSIVVLLSLYLSYPWLAYRAKKHESYLLAVVFIFYAFITVHDALYLIKLNDAYPLSAYTAPITTLLIAIILAMRLAQNIRKIEHFNQTLAENVLQATKALELSLNTQHRLELDNIRLQERMHLAHDLHDGLGGSLVRSMAIIDQSPSNLSNQQFLSMLKVLRDDLRQIIDTGSSSNNSVPETPMIWGAAIRYRFMQIFDELDIASTWRFPEQWMVQPTALDCLTLLRVIEESLTNIIKHSQASHVKVELYYVNHSQLILEIIDDGIGFDVDAVAKSGISVGLRSMQIRLVKTNATLHIESSSKGTIVKVTQSLLAHPAPPHRR